MAARTRPFSSARRARLPRATTFDGWPLCQKGRADLGLYTSLLSSAFGALWARCSCSALAARWRGSRSSSAGRKVFWLCLFGLSTIAVMTPDNMGKGIVSGAVGILVSTIGLDPNTGAPRFTFGTYDPLAGRVRDTLHDRPVLILASTVPHRYGQELHCGVPPGTREPSARCFRYLAAHCKTILVRSSVLGTWIGMLPGAGGEIASIISVQRVQAVGRRTLPAMARGALRGSPPPKARTMRSSAARSSPC